MSTFYDDLAEWWPLISPVEDYADEATFFLDLIAAHQNLGGASLLELGSGGGNNAFYMKKAFREVVLSDLSENMLAVSRRLNPDCEHQAGDLRTLRLGRQFEVVFVHDAIDYMTSPQDLQQAIATVFLHCKPGGLAILVPDTTRETFEDGAADQGGSDGEGRSVRFLEWDYDPDPSDTHYLTQYVFVLQVTGEAVRVAHEEHHLGLFSREEWLGFLRAAGFQAQDVVDEYGRHVFLGRKSL
jgi:trans-aconitate methyltransferase